MPHFAAEFFRGEVGKVVAGAVGFPVDDVELPPVFEHQVNDSVEKSAGDRPFPLRIFDRAEPFAEKSIEQPLEIAGGEGAMKGVGEFQLREPFFRRNLRQGEAGAVSCRERRMKRVADQFRSRFDHRLAPERVAEQAVDLQLRSHRAAHRLFADGEVDDFESLVDGVPRLFPAGEGERTGVVRLFRRSVAGEFVVIIGRRTLQRRYRRVVRRFEFRVTGADPAGRDGISPFRENRFRRRFGVWMVNLSGERRERLRHFRRNLQRQVAPGVGAPGTVLQLLKPGVLHAEQPFDGGILRPGSAVGSAEEGAAVLGAGEGDIGEPELFLHALVLLRAPGFRRIAQVVFQQAPVVVIRTVLL